MSAERIDAMVNNCSAQLKWLDCLFLQKCLQRISDNKVINVIGFDVAPATKKGENFASDILRVSVHFTDDTKSNDLNGNYNTIACDFIIKVALVGDSANSLNELNVYDKEMEMYEKILPQLKTLLHKAGANRKIFADTIYVSKPHKAILFEDLSIKGYRSKSGKDGFDMQHAKAILSRLAKFHGAAAVLQEQQPDIFKNFQHGMINRNVSTLHIMHLTIFDEVIDLIAEWPDFTYYTEKLRKFRPHLIEKERQGFDAVPDEFNTLIHGDLWFTNTMLKNDGDKLDNVTLIDFQLNCWTSPAIDLHYFLSTSVNEKLQMRHQHELVQYYHKKLTTILKRLNYQKHIPNLLEFQIQFLARSIWGFTASCIISPVQLTEECDDADVAALLGTDQRAMNFKRLAVRSPKMQTKLRTLIPKFDSLGVFDCDINDS